MVTYKTCLQMSDFEYLGKAHNIRSAQVIEEIIDKKCENRKSYAL